MDDDLTKYFSDSGFFNGVNHYWYNNLKDSLPDGTYLFYNVKRADSSNKRKKVIIQGNYIKRVKNGLFETNVFYYTNRHKKVNYISTQSAMFKDGIKHGANESFVYYTKTNRYAQNQYIEYSKGKKHGVEISFYKGAPTSINIYENGELISTHLLKQKK